MSTRLQVLVDDEELDESRRTAARHRMTVSEWVRQALRQARRGEATEEASTKLTAVRDAARHAWPSGDIETMLDEIARDRLPDSTG